jgi:hypothetical protein
VITIPYSFLKNIDIDGRAGWCCGCHDERRFPTLSEEPIFRCQHVR